MAYQIVDSAELTTGRGPHPAGSPFDKHVSRALGLTAFEVYKVELPPGAETVVHDHVADQVEDVYAFLSGSGWVIVDGDPVAVEPAQYVAVSMESSRYVRAGKDGLDFMAICG